MDELLTPKDVKRLFRCSLPWIYKASATGLLPSIRIPCPGLGARKKELVRFKKEDVFVFLESHYRKR